MLMGLRREFDFETNTFRNTALSILYVAVFIASTYFYIQKESKNWIKNFNFEIKVGQLKIPILTNQDHIL